MKKKILVVLLFFLIFLCFLLQCSAFDALSFGGIGPNLLIIMTASIGFMKGEKDGIWAGFFSGILIDVFFGNVIGLYALIYMYIGYMNGKFSRIFYPEDIKLPLALIALSDMSFGMICYVFLFLLNGRFDFMYYFTHIIIAEMVYTIVISIILYPVILFLYKKLDVEDNRSDSYLA